MISACAVRTLAAPVHAPITTTEFGNALLKIWGLPRVQQLGERRATIGLAVSGGVDSMALATLCSRLRGSPSQVTGNSSQHTLHGLVRRLRFEAFVVDHSMRAGSDTEATKVSSILEQRGIPTKILKIDWPEAQSPSRAPNFESLARRYRYRLLGNACLARGIDSLLLAHHEDDQAETILMRLIGGHRTLGLTGIKADASMPECYGVHGVHESGGWDVAHSVDIHIDDVIGPLPTLSNSFSRHRNQPVPETGGIKICRPLLEFSKLRLTATCEEEGMPWFDDVTNQDPKITTRNAIRHIQGTYVLPAALSKPRLLALRKGLMERTRASRRALIWALRECHITSFDTGTGTLRVVFPESDHFRKHSACPNSSTGKLAAEMLRRIILLVSPEETVELSSLHGAVARILADKTVLDGKIIPKAFTCNSVHFQPIPPTSSENNATLGWFLSRQPYQSRVDKHPSLCFTPNGRKWSPWNLYDGRYWIRVQNFGRDDILVRPFRKDEKRKLLEIQTTVAGSDLQRILQRSVPGNVRWTLPAFVVRKKDDSESILGLPTLNTSTPAFQDMAKWELRYKGIDLDGITIHNE